MKSALTFHPALTKSLGYGAETLLTGLSFDDIDAAAKLQATKGNEAAFKFLQAFQTKSKAA